MSSRALRKDGPHFVELLAEGPDPLWRGADARPRALAEGQVGAVCSKPPTLRSWVFDGSSPCRALQSRAGGTGFGRAWRLLASSLRLKTGRVRGAPRVPFSFVSSTAGPRPSAEISDVLGAARGSTVGRMWSSRRRNSTSSSSRFAEGPMGADGRPRYLIGLAHLVSVASHVTAAIVWIGTFVLLRCARQQLLPPFPW